MTQTLVGLLRTHRPRGWPLAYKSLPVPGPGKVSQVTSVTLSVYVLFYFDALVYLQGLRRYSPKTLDQVLRTTVKTPKIRPKIRPIL
jgi:hypothetical protein